MAIVHLLTDTVGFDVGNEPGDWTKYGLPVLNASEVSGCGGEPDQAGCTWQSKHLISLVLYSLTAGSCQLTAFFTKFGRRRPVYAPWTTPVYSNIGFAILGLVVESVTGQTYEQFVSEAILAPLNLTRTSISTPTDRNVVEASWFGSDLGIENSYVYIKPRKKETILTTLTSAAPVASMPVPATSSPWGPPSSVRDCCPPCRRVAG